MNYLCARCHHEFSVDGDGDELPPCSKCGAEAGLEPIHGIPMAMKLFGAVLGGVIVLAIGGGLLSRIMG